MFILRPRRHKTRQTSNNVSFIKKGVLFLVLAEEKGNRNVKFS